MSEQVTFIQPLKAARRKTTKLKDIVANLKRLSGFYETQKPGLRSMTISADDAYTLRNLWKKKDAKVDGEAELRSQGFHINQQDRITWQSWDLLEQGK